MTVIGFLQSKLQSNPTVELTVVGDSMYSDYIRSLGAEDTPAIIPEEPITGFFQITNSTGKPISHKGFQVSIIGCKKEKGGKVIEQFFHKSQTVRQPSEMGVDENITDAFEFTNIRFPVCSYRGISVDVEYAIEFRVLHSVLDFVVTKPFIVLFFDPPVAPVPYHTEIGIKDELSVAFDLANTTYDCLATVKGTVHFQFSKIHMQKIELELFCWEKCSSDAMECERARVVKRRTIAKRPKDNDRIAFKFHLSGCNIWPYKGQDNDPLRVKYYLQVGMTDNTGKHYHKKFPLVFQRFAILR